MKTLGEARRIDLDGHLLAWDRDRNRPSGVRIEGQLFLAIFSTEEKLRTFMDGVNAPPYTIKCIDDAADFLLSVSVHRVPVCLDPRHEEGRVRFSLVVNLPPDPKEDS